MTQPSVDSALTPELVAALHGKAAAIPTWIATCSEDGMPNVTTLSVVHYVDSERVALSRQFFNKTSVNLDADPRSQVMLVDPETIDQVVLDLLRRLATCVTYDDATRAALEALEGLFGFGQSILLVAAEAGDRLFAVASNGYRSSAAGAEVPVGTGLAGVAAQRRRVVCGPNLALSRGMRAAIGEALERRDQGRLHQADGSAFVDDEYVVEGVPSLRRYSRPRPYGRSAIPIRRAAPISDRRGGGWPR